MVLFLENIFIKNVMTKIKSQIGIKNMLIKMHIKLIANNRPSLSGFVKNMLKLKNRTNIKNKSAIEVHLKILSTLFITLFYQKSSIMTL